MKIIGNRDVLTENIGIVAKAVSGKTTIQILECILIIADEKGVRLIGNDLEIGIETVNIDAEVVEEGSVAIEAKIFLDIMRRLPMGNVTVQSDKNNITLIKSQKTEFKILGYPGEEFPLLPEIEKSFRYTAPANVLRNMIRQTIFSVASDDSKPIMTGELIEFKNGILKLVAIDGFRVSLRETRLTDCSDDENDSGAVEIDGEDGESATVTQLVPNVRAVVPGKALNEISKILPQSDEAEVGIYFSEKHVMFEIESCIVVSRLIEGDFINYENIFTPDYTTLVYVDRESLLESIERTALISKDTKKSPARLNITAGRMVITSVTEMGNAYDEIDIEIDGMPIEIAFNPRYLIEALKAIEEDDIRIQFTTPLSPCIIRSEDVKNYKYLVLPLRLKN